MSEMHRLEEAQAKARAVIEALTPGCLRLAVAGSVRRGQPYVRDIEVVAIPDLTPPKRLVFGEVASGHTPFERVLAGLRGGLLVPAGADGPKYKKFFLHAHGGLKLDLWLCEAANWGNILAIRTGDRDFSHALVTTDAGGGLMPPGLAQRDGYLWRHEAHGDVQLACRTEEAFFAALGIEEVPEPSQRSAAVVKQLRDRRFALPGKARVA